VEKMSKYLELKKQNESLFDEFSKNNIYWIFAFSTNEFEKKLIELNLKRDEIVSIGAGGFIKKESINSYNQLSRVMINEIETIKNDDDELRKAFMYELANHEYCITYDLDDTLDALGLTRKQLQDDIRLALIMNDACVEYLSNSEAY
jgi:hypothetical protein